MPFQIIRDDITRVKADAIVNTANPKPMVGSGTDHAIYKAAGKRLLLAERRKIGELAPGRAASTSAFHLNAKYIIHTVGPVWVDGSQGEREILHSCYSNALEKAAALGCESIAFPLIATGAYGFPKDEALQIALSEISTFLLGHDMKVILVVFDRKAVELSGRLVESIEEYIDEHAVSMLRKDEYDRGFSSERRLREINPATSRNEPFADFNAERRHREASPAPSRNKPFASFNAEGRHRDASPAPSRNNPFDWLHSERRSREAKNTDAYHYEANHWGEGASSEDDIESGVMFRAMPYATFPNVSGKELDDMLMDAGDTFQQRLLQLIDESGLDDVAVYKKANIDRKVFSRIRCKKDYKPKKKTAVAFAIALELDMDTMTDLLARAEIAFSPSSKFDLIIMYFVSHQIYDVFEINAALFKYGQPILGE